MENRKDLAAQIRAAILLSANLDAAVDSIMDIVELVEPAYWPEGFKVVHLLYDESNRERAVKKIQESKPGDVFTYSGAYSTEEIYALMRDRGIGVVYATPNTLSYKKYGSQTFIITAVHDRKNKNI